MSRILLRGAQVITMTPDRPDAEHVDSLVDGHTIAAVGETIEAPDAEVVDFSGRVIIPGLVNAHLHTWQTALRSARADWTLMEYLTHLHGELWPAHDPVATVLHADIANIEAVMVAGTWRKRDHVLLASGLDEVKDQLRESGELLLRSIRAAGSPG